MLRIDIFLIFAAGLIFLRKTDSGQAGSTSQTNHLAPAESGRCEVYDENLTICSFDENLRRTDSNVAVMRAWTATALRENILSILGYMLHSENNTLSPDTYTALYLLYREVQRNNVKMMELIPRLKNIIKNKRVPQVVSLLKSMHAVTPAYFKSALKEVIKDFSRHKEMARSFTFLEEVDEQGISLLDNIDKRLLPLLRYKNSTKVLNKNLESAYGKEFAKFYIGVREGHIPLTQPVLGAMMMNMKWSGLSPDEIEDFYFLVDSLRYSNITGWKPNPYGDVPCCYEAKDPYELVNSGLSSIPDVDEVDKKIKDIVTNLLPKLVEPSNIAVNPYYKQMEPFLGRRFFDVDLLFDEFSGNYGMPDLKPLKTPNTGTYEIKIAVEGFIRFTYNKPDHMMLGFVRRLMNRVPLSDKKREIITKAYTVLRERYLEDTNQKMISTGRVKRDLDKLRISAHPLGKILAKNLIVWKGIFLPSMCNNDRTCPSEMSDMLLLTDLADVARPIKANYTPCVEVYSHSSLITWTKQLHQPASLISPEFIKEASTILFKVFNDTEIMKHVSIEILRMKSVLHADRYYYQFPKTITETRRQQLYQILKAMLTVKKVYARPLVLYEVIRLLCLLIQDCTDESLLKIADDSWLDKPSTHDSIEDLLREANHRIAQLLHEQQFYKALSGIEPKDYSTNRMVLLAMIRRILGLDAVKNNEKIYNEVVRLLRAIHRPCLNLTPLAKTLVIDEIEDIKFAILVSETMTYPSLIYELGVDFNIGVYRTDGSLLQSILKQIVNLARDKNETSILESMKKIISKVDCSNNYTEVVQSIQNSATTDVINFERILNGALVKSITPDILRAIQNMSKWNQTIFDPMFYVQKMNLSRYETRAEFMDAFYDTVIKNVDINVAMLKRDIQVLHNAILRKGRGTAPADYGLM